MALAGGFVNARRADIAPPSRYTATMSDDPRPPIPDPMPGPTPDQVALGLRLWFRRILGVILLAALGVVIVRGIYVVWLVSQESAVTPS